MSFDENEVTEITEVTEDEQAQIQAEQERLEQERLEQERLEIERQEELERQEAEERAREQARIEHENFLKSFPETTVFYQELREEGDVKWLCGTVKDAHTAESFGWLDNHYDEGELTFVPYNKELTSGVYYLKGHEKPESTIEELKAKKLAEISAEAHKYSQYECGEMYLTSSKGFRINADGRAQDNIKGLIALGVTCRFKDYDNEFHSGTTVEDLNVMLLECYQNGASLYQQKFEYEARVDTAESREDLYFDVTFEMADFSTK